MVSIENILNSCTSLKHKTKDEAVVGVDLHSCENVIVFVHLIVPTIKNKLSINNKEAHSKHDPEN